MSAEECVQAIWSDAAIRMKAPPHGRPLAAVPGIVLHEKISRRLLESKLPREAAEFRAGDGNAVAVLQRLRVCPAVRNTARFNLLPGRHMHLVLPELLAQWSPQRRRMCLGHPLTAHGSAAAPELLNLALQTPDAGCRDIPAPTPLCAQWAPPHYGGGATAQQPAGPPQASITDRTLEFLALELNTFAFFAKTLKSQRARRILCM
eukprot:CAMPEP_0206147052 /NCGR_PEP_ID=MMETSP1473-20131121/32273_1 /ASSEMBLY_ACC=CAM_ASM_001109 /TAXON_ID=1461547 /ORGANISM="Stichococcus sp, Strain RCC1054" /LENGTH=204 /DNA_ID=CAMNT_0053543845 /DNA_START=478 /DNA_END=1092 /DNA_ORIENTATION=+